MKDIILLTIGCIILIITAAWGYFRDGIYIALTIAIPLFLYSGLLFLTIKDYWKYKKRRSDKQ